MQTARQAPGRCGIRVWKGLGAGERIQPQTRPSSAGAVLWAWALAFPSARQEALSGEGPGGAGHGGRMPPWQTGLCHGEQMPPEHCPSVLPSRADLRAAWHCPPRARQLKGEPSKARGPSMETSKGPQSAALGPPTPLGAALLLRASGRLGPSPAPQRPYWWRSCSSGPRSCARGACWSRSRSACSGPGEEARPWSAWPCGRPRGCSPRCLGQRRRS